MYVSTELSFKLDEIIKSFEVSLRSYLANKIQPRFSNENDFKDYLVDLQTKQTPTSIVFSSRIDSILKFFIKDYKKIYLLFQDASGSTDTQDYTDNQVPYISHLINLIILFFKDLEELKGVSNDYTTVEDFLYKCSLYHRVRNDLSHPGSKKILKNEASEILKFINKFIEYLDDKYFWYMSKDKIGTKIDNYYKEEKNKILKFDNLKNMSVSHQKTLCRESELKLLHDLILGENQYSRLSGSTVIYGYGGVGKTALVIDFIYETILKMQEEEFKDRYDFILFFSSKEEILTSSNTTGEFYIDKIHIDIHSYDEITKQIFSLLKVQDLMSLQQTKLKGIIVIDNIENLLEDEKEKIFSFMKQIPRDIQFIVTSRSEEKTEEKLHLSEFQDFDKGKEFILSYIKTNDFDIEFNDSEIKILLSATKGNTLLLVQSLYSLNDKTTTLNEISIDLNNYESSSFEKVASFMYKNTFDNAIHQLEQKSLSPKDVILVATLYKEKIDLYALSELTGLGINEVRDICNYLTSKLIFNKSQEFYSVNEFAGRFIFISLMPNQREKELLEKKIYEYKKDLDNKLSKLEEQMKSNKKIDVIIKDWKPSSYIDTIVIAQAFQMYDKFSKAIWNKNTNRLSELFDEYSKYEYTSKHPYIRFQKARILNLLISKRFYGKKTRNERIMEIKRSYEDTLESINTVYSYIKNTESHIAVLMLFGFFLNRDLHDSQKAMRYLEDAKVLQSSTQDKKYYLILNELSELYLKMYQEKNDNYYIEQYNDVYNMIINSNVPHHIFSISKYKGMQKNLKMRYKIGV